MILERLVQWHRRKRVGWAIERGDLEQLAQVLDLGVDLSTFTWEAQVETYEIATHTQTIPSVLAWAKECNLPAAGFELLLQAGAPIDPQLEQLMAEQAHHPLQYPEAASIHALFQRQALLHDTPAPATTASRPRL